MKVNVADLSKHSFRYLGAKFLDTETNLFDAKGINTSPQVLNVNQQLDDTMNWQTVSGSFIANGNEAYLLIGYFFSEVQDDTIQILDSNVVQSQGYGYYYIDDVQVLDMGRVDNCVFEFEVPNVFTPNADGNNDVLDFSFIGNSEEIKFVVLNRWGSVIYEYSEESPVWNGKTKLGNDCSDGVYFYRLSYVQGNEPVNKTGFIHLTR